MTIGWKTLDQGAQALVYDIDGQARVEVGPQRLFLWRQKFIPLIFYTVNQNEYLIIRHKHGVLEHRPGPCTVFKNPLKHESISTAKAISLSAHEVLVVYQQDPKTKETTRYLQHGPTVFVPKSNEWLHEFCWHGTSPDNKTQKIPNALQFTKLQVIPDQLYYNVDEVRTADDALIRIKLMMFFELTDIELMLNSTQDPIADFINCLCADVISFASKLTYIEFIDKASGLNDLSCYPQLLERCKVIGYRVTKVVFRGYYASPKLQSMHDQAIQSRTALKMEYETEEQQQNLTDMKLQSELERIHTEQKLEMEQLKHKHEIERSQHSHKLLMGKNRFSGKMKAKMAEEQAKLEGEKAKDDEQLNYMSKLNSLGVDLTAYLLSQEQRPAKVVNVVAEQNAANLHLHHN